MEAKADSLPKAGGPPKRKLRNYLLDSRFQLKYTGMVVVVTVIVAAALGYVAYGYSRDQTRMYTASIAMQPDLAPGVANDLEGYAHAQDRKVMMSIIGGILVLALALGLTGIIVTHKVVGPAYKLRRLLGDVADGRLAVEGRLRKGDELQDVFIAFQNMVEHLRARQAVEVSQLDAALEKAREAGVANDALGPIIEVRDRMQKTLE